MTNGTGNAGGGGHQHQHQGSGGALAIEKIAQNIADNLKKQLGDHPHLDKAAVIKAVTDKIATL